MTIIWYNLYHSVYECPTLFCPQDETVLIRICKVPMTKQFKHKCKNCIISALFQKLLFSYYCKNSIPTYYIGHYGTLNMQFLSFLMILWQIECLITNFQISWKNPLNQDLGNCYKYLGSMGTLTDFYRKC